MSTVWTSDPHRSRLSQVTTRVRWWRSLRLRVAAAIALLAAVLVLGVGLVLAALALDSAKTLLRDQAVAQVDAGLAVFGFGGAPPPGVIVDDDKIPAPLIHAIIDRQTAGAVTWDDGRAMWAARSAQPSGIIATKVSNAVLQQQAKRISSTLLWTTAAAVLLAALVAWIIADRLTARLRDAAASVNWTIGGRQVPRRGRTDEVTVMMIALEQTAAAFLDRLQRERKFTADVAHDLRTPLTALVSATELLDESPEAARVVRQVGRMRTLVEDLLELARADDDLRAEDVLLSETLRDALDHLAPTPDCSMTIEVDGTVLADPVRLRSALINLVQNARRHGAAPVSITVRGRSVIVEDRGPGFPERLLVDGPRRFTALGATGGSGLGLAIAVEHAHNAGATLTLRNRDGGGAIAILEFAPDDSSAAEPAAELPSVHRP